MVVLLPILEPFANLNDAPQTMEVAVARVYNWDVVQKRKEKEEEEKTKGKKSKTASDG